MFNFTFGLIWLAITTPIFLLFILVPGAERGGAEVSLIPVLGFITFEVIGFYLLISGLKQIIKNRKTEKHGTQCFGMICDIQKTGAYSNGKAEYKAKVYFINPETRGIEKLEEIIGFDYNKYQIGSYIKCKYYQDDINISDQIQDYEVPEYIREYLDVYRPTPDISDIEFSSDREYVIIDGVRYRKD